MDKAEPWQTAEIAGPKKAKVITKPAVVTALINKAKHPLFVVGHKTINLELSEKNVVDVAIALAKTAELPVLATAHTVSAFLKRGMQPAAWMAAVDIGNRLTDPDWDGVTGGGQHDLALFLGLPYYMQWLILSGLKHYAYKHLTTISLDRFYHPHATWSFPNTSLKKWEEHIQMIIEQIRGEK